MIQINIADDKMFHV